MGIVKHGGAVGRPSPEYRAWQGMLRRCYRPKDKRYHCYGGRGIMVCARWRTAFGNFIQDMGPRPVGYSLERRDNDAGYRPDNCYWAPSNQQQKNRSTTKLNWDKVKQIRALLPEKSQLELAAMFNVDPSLISCIARGKIWKSSDTSY